MKKTTQKEKPEINAIIEPGVSPWTKDGIYFGEIPAKALGFIYLIRHKPSGKGYIGRKLFWFKKTKQVKGKKKKILAESDWRSYWSSCEEIQKLVEQEGEANFTREVLHIAYNKGTLNYLEAREQMDRRVLESPDAWYNGQIQCRVHWSHVKLQTS